MENSMSRVAKYEQREQVHKQTLLDWLLHAYEMTDKSNALKARLTKELSQLTSAEPIMLSAESKIS